MLRNKIRFTRSFFSFFLFWYLLLSGLRTLMKLKGNRWKLVGVDPKHTQDATIILNIWLISIKYHKKKKKKKSWTKDFYHSHDDSTSWVYQLDAMIIGLTNYTSTRDTSQKIRLELVAKKFVNGWIRYSINNIMTEIFCLWQRLIEVWLISQSRIHSMIMQHFNKKKKTLQLAYKTDTIIAKCFKPNIILIARCSKLFLTLDCKMLLSFFLLLTARCFKPNLIHIAGCFNPFSAGPIFSQVQKVFFRKFIASSVFMLERYIKRPFF